MLPIRIRFWCQLFGSFRIGGSAAQALILITVPASLPVNCSEHLAQDVELEQFGGDGPTMD